MKTSSQSFQGIKYTLSDVGDSDAHYWVAEDNATGKVYARGNDRAKVVREADAAILEANEVLRNQQSQSRD